MEFTSSIQLSYELFRLEQLGLPPLIIDLRAEPGTDDDHVIAVFKLKGLWGALAKSNFSVIRYREPVYRNVRELVMTFFEGYFNMERERTLREYSLPFDLRRVNHLCWRTLDDNLPEVEAALDRSRHFDVMPKWRRRGLTRIDDRYFSAAIVGMKDH